MGDLGTSRDRCSLSRKVTVHPFESSPMARPKHCSDEQCGRSRNITCILELEKDNMQFAINTRHQDQAKTNPAMSRRTRYQWCILLQCMLLTRSCLL